MTYAALVLLVLLPAAVGWGTLIRMAWRWHSARQSRLRTEAYRELVATDFAAGIAAHRTAIQRKRKLRSVKFRDCEIVTLGPDGPKSAA